MSFRRAIKPIAVVFALFIASWVSYSWWVMTLDDRYADVRAVLQIAERVAPDASVEAQVVVIDIENGEPKPNERVEVFVDDDKTPVDEGKTDENGLFVTDIGAPGEATDVEVSARIGDGIAAQKPTTSFAVVREHSMLVQTDKPRYQPGQDIEIRAVLRELGGEPVEDDVNIRVEDPDGTLFFDRELATNQFGMVQTQFPLAGVAGEGTYRIRAGYEDVERVKAVEVKQYTLPRFDVDVVADADAYRPGDAVEFEIAADYFFGEPVADGSFALEGAGYVGEMETFTEIEGQLDGDGSATVEVELPDYFVASSDDGQKGLATVEIDVTDGAGDTETVVEELTVSEHDIIIDAIPAGGSLVEGAENEVWITTRTPDGQPLAADVEVESASGETESLKTNEQGIGAVTVAVEGGFDGTWANGGWNYEKTWEVSATSAVDLEGEERRGSTEVLFGDDEISELGLVVERAGYAVGETVAAELVSGRPEGTVYVELVGDGVTHATHTVELEEHRASFNFDVDPQMTGMLEIRAWMVGLKGSLARTAALVAVGDAEQLDVQLSPETGEFEPGEPVTIEVETIEDGQPVPASAGLDIVDEAVFAVGGDDRDDIVAAHFGIERDLLEPTAWLYDGAAAFAGGGDTPVTGGFTDVEPAVSSADGLVDMVDRMVQTQRAQAERNGWIVVFFLLVIPLAFLAWVFAHRDRDCEPVTKIGSAVVGLVAMGITGALILGTTWGLVMFLEQLEGHGGFEVTMLTGFSLVVLVGIPGLSLWHASRGGEKRFLYGLAVLWGLFVVIVSMLVYLREAIQLPLDSWLWEFGTVVVLLGIPLSLAPVVGRGLRERRTLDVLAPLVMGAVGLMAFFIFGLEEFLLAPGLLFWTGFGALWWIALHTDSEVPASRKLTAGALGGVVTLLVAVGLQSVTGLMASAGIGGPIVVVACSVCFLWLLLSCVGRAGDDGISMWGGFAGLVVGFGVMAVVTAVIADYRWGRDLLVLCAIATMGAALMYLAGRQLQQRLFLIGSGFVFMGAVITGPVAGTLVDFETLRFSSEPLEELQFEDRFADFDAEAGDADDGIEVREYFPETLFSDIVITGDDGRAQIEVEMADSITNWKLDATAVSGSGAVGTADADATVFQPFFIEPQLPVSLTQGDSVVVPVSVFNYGEEPLELTVELTDGDWFDADSYQQRLQLDANRVDAVEFEVEATENGEHTFELIARVDSAEDGETIGDAVRRDIEIEPHGRQETAVRSGRLDGDVTETVEIPSAAVEGSELAVVQFNPGLLGELVDGMDSLLRMPTGCFEQTSSALYPNAMALAYMQQTDSANPEIQQRAERYIAEGYQRILTFEVGRGGYSLFGNVPASVPITVYGLRMLTDIDEVYSVDSRVLERMSRFVIDEQNDNGSWDVDRRTTYVVGIGDRLGLTAFISWSLAAFDPDSDAVGDGLHWIESELVVGEESTRNLALILNLLLTVDDRSLLQQEIIDELTERAEPGGDTPTWNGTGDEGRAGSAADAERTALATLGLLRADEEPALVEDGLSYLVESKSEFGWGTTQATVAALEALIAGFDDGDTVDEGEVAVKRDGQHLWSLQLDEEVTGEAQLVDMELDSGENNIEIAAPDDSGYFYKLETRYHVPWDDDSDDEDLRVEVEYDRTELTVDDRVEVTATLDVDEPVGMGLVEVGVPPGFETDRDSLDGAVERDEISDWEQTQRRVTLYVEDVDEAVEATFDIIATQPIEASSGSSSAYDYYTPERHTEQGPVDFVVR